MLWPVASTLETSQKSPRPFDLRRKLPGVQIIVGADNDKAGLENARKAAAVVGGILKYPEFDPGDSGTDWNDFAAVYGARFLREAIRG
jgi:phage/plasmid primase-like uncharacterized protein